MRVEGIRDGRGRVKRELTTFGSSLCRRSPIRHPRLLRQKATIAVHPVMPTLLTVPIPTSTVLEPIPALIAESEATATLDKVAAVFPLHPKLALRTLLEIRLFQHRFEHFIQLVRIRQLAVFLTGHILMPVTATFEAVVFVAGGTLEVRVFLSPDEDVLAVWSGTAG